MAKKKVTKKKKISNNAPVNEQEKVIMVLQELQQHAGWAVIVNNFKANIAYLEDVILDKVDMEGNEIDEIMVDKFRDKREIMKDLIKTPETFIAQLRQSPIENDGDDLDPFHTNAGESRSADRQEVEAAKAEYGEPET